MGWLPQIVMLQSPKAVVPLVFTAELEAAHRQYFYPWKLTASALHFHSAKFCLSFFHCWEDSKQRVWAVNKFPPPTHTEHTHTHTGCIWAKRAFWNHKHLSYLMIAFSHVALLNHRGEEGFLFAPWVSRPDSRAHVTPVGRATVHKCVHNLNMSNNKAAWQLHAAEQNTPHSSLLFTHCVSDT